MMTSDFRHPAVSEDGIQHISLALYNFICQHIVGSDKMVKTKRSITTVFDNLSYDEGYAQITSGSFGEGLEMKGSDFDYMYVQTPFQVYKDIEWNVFNAYFKINTEDTKLGFVKLQLRHDVKKTTYNVLCVKDNNNLFLSNILFKHHFSNVLRSRGSEHMTEIIHGPCLSDKDGMFDFAYCFHSKSWISQADHWRTRSHGSWPCNNIVSSIVEHGVLFVPIGVKGSPNEEIEWRISFSVGEKLLIYSFNHTQLLCYALMKIVLKDIISTDIRCKDLLCSYYLKNILFWVSEETSLSEWKPRNLIDCFIRCFKRLMYCVEYSLCPHYFIPEINMFENKIEGQNRQVLLDNLYTLYNLGWRCILLSPQMQMFSDVNLMLHTYPQSFGDYLEHINLSAVLHHIQLPANYNRAVRDIMFYQSPSIKLYNYLHLLYASQNKANEIELNQTDTNKTLYRKYKTCQSYLAQGVRCNAVSGWLKLASCYYRIKQYRKVLVILAYALSKCSPEMIKRQSKLSTPQRQLLVSNVIQRKGLVRVLQLLHLNYVKFKSNSTLIPQELELEILTHEHRIPPVVFAHFLSFLCHYHLNDVREYKNSLDDLLNTLSEEDYFRNGGEQCTSINIIGIVLQMIGKHDAAMRAFQWSAAIDPRGLISCAQLRLSMMNDV